MDLAVLPKHCFPRIRVRGGDFILHFIVFALDPQGSQKQKYRLADSGRGGGHPHPFFIGDLPSHYRTGTGCRVPDSRPGNRKTGPGPDAGYRIAGQETGKPDRDRMPGTGQETGKPDQDRMPEKRKSNKKRF